MSGYFIEFLQEIPLKILPTPLKTKNWNLKMPPPPVGKVGKLSKKKHQFFGLQFFPQNPGMAQNQAELMNFTISTRGVQGEGGPRGGGNWEPYIEP